MLSVAVGIDEMAGDVFAAATVGTTSTETGRALAE